MEGVPILFRTLRGLLNAGGGFEMMSKRPWFRD